MSSASIFPAFENYLRTSGIDAGAFEGAVFIGSLKGGRFNARIGLGGAGIESPSVLKGTGPYLGFPVYEILHEHGMNFRDYLPVPGNYNAQSYREIPVRFKLEKGEEIVILTEPLCLSPTDYWCIAGTREHPFFRFSGDAVSFLDSLQQPDV